MPNDEVLWFEKILEQAKELALKKESAEKAIREGFKNKAIIFIDVVGSTEFKTRYQENPEIWILRVKQFSELIASAISQCNGSVIKYIGDEVMGSFENINDAKNLVVRISEIEKTLETATGFETRIKTAIDFGPVYELEFAGHSSADPQGSIVDRCARISKYATAGEVLASAEFVENTPQLNWKKVGSVELKGLGKEIVYQLERVSISLAERIEINKEEYDRSKENLQELRTENSQLKEKVRQLRNQLQEIGQAPIVSSVEQEANLTLVERAINNLKNVIDGAPGSSNYYARFIFLDHSGKVGELYNKYEGKIFDDLIESNLVESDDDNYYSLNYDHPRNKRISQLITILDKELDAYLSENEPDNEDLFEWNTSDAEFWKKYIGYNVIRG